MKYIPSVAQAMLVKGTSLWARAIQRATNSPYSHVGFAFEGRTYEMDFGGFYSRDLETYAWDYDLFDIQGMDEGRSFQLRKDCLLNRGTRYDYGKVLGQGIELFFHYAGVRRLIDSKSAMSCAEWFQARLLPFEICLACDQTVVSPALIAKDPVLSYAASVPAYKGRR